MVITPLTNMIAAGIQYLLQTQTIGDGSWDVYGEPVAETATATLALLNAGYSISNPAVSSATMATSPM